MGLDLPLHVETVGPDPDTDGETFVLLHGFGASSFTWRHWAPALASRGHVVLVDMKGFGSAPKPDDGHYGPLDQAELVHRLILQRGLEHVTLIGHSLGGGVSLLTALRLLDEGEGRLRRMILVGGAAYRQKLPPFVALARRPRLSGFLLSVLGPRRVIRFVLRTIVFDPAGVSRAQIEGYADPLRDRAGRRALLWSGAQIVPPALDDLTARFREIVVPTLLLWGRHDRVVPLWVGERLQEELPQGELEVFEKCGHVPPEELPEQTLEAVLGFLDRTG